MRMRFLVAVLVAGLLSVGGVETVNADTVELTNGNSYEDVIAEVDDEGVSIRLAFGVIRLPHDRVARVDKSSSPLAEYLDREAKLDSRGDTEASSWLALAQWASRHDLTHGARESAFRAARIDPDLEGLAALLEPAGYRFDDELDRWLPLDEYMARRGLVRSGGTWITLEEQQRRVTERRAALEEARREAERRRPAPRAATDQAPVVVVPITQPVTYTVPFWGVWHHAEFFKDDTPHRRRREVDRTLPRTRHRQVKHRRNSYRDLADRQPGSFLPVNRSSAGSAEH